MQGEVASTARRRAYRGSRIRMVGWTVLSFLIAAILMPFIYMIFMSLKSNGEIYTQFWALPRPPKWHYYGMGWELVGPYIVNTLVFSVSSTIIAVGVAALASYALARHPFPGRELVFYSFLALLMIPAVLVLVPRYLLVARLRLANSPWVLILPWAASLQPFGILLCRTYMASLPEELFESARLDGASEVQILLRLALPLSWPILATMAVQQLFSTYNDYVWPLVTISKRQMQVVSVGLAYSAREAQGRLFELGPQAAGFLLSSLPLVLLFILGMRYFVRGMTTGALKM